FHCGRMPGRWRDVDGALACARTVGTSSDFRAVWNVGACHAGVLRLGPLSVETVGANGTSPRLYNISGVQAWRLCLHYKRRCGRWDHGHTILAPTSLDRALGALADTSDRVDP